MAVSLSKCHLHPNDCERGQVVCWLCDDNFKGYPLQIMDPRLRYTQRLKDDAAMTVIQSLVDSISSDYRSLQTTVSQYGDMILERWMAKTVEQRGKMLQRSLPKGVGTTGIGKKWDTLKKYHDFENFPFNRLGINVPAAALKRRSEYRTAVMLSSLDLEAFRMDKTALLCLLQNRTQYPPSRWAPLDHTLNDMARVSGLLARRYNETFFNISENKDEKYGSPLAWTDKRFHQDCCLMCFPNAEVLFEFQSKLYAFLRKIVDALVAETKRTEQCGSKEWKSQATSCFRSKADKASTMYPAEEPGIGQASDRHLRSPPGVDIDKFIQCARKRQSIAEDELFLLQNDAVAAKAKLKDLRQARYYSSMPELGNKKQDDEWSCLALDFWKWPYIRAANWDDIIMWAEYVKKDDTAAARHYLYHHIKITIGNSYYTDMMRDVLRKGHIFEKQLDGCPRFLKDKSDNDSAGFHREQKKHILNDPLIWAMRDRSPYSSDDITRRLASVVQVCARSIMDLDNDDLAKLSSSGVVDLVADLSLLSCMATTLEAQNPPVSRQDGPYYKAERVDAKLKDWIKTYRESGPHYHNSLITWTDVFGGYSRDVQPDSGMTGQLLQKFYSSDKVTAPRYLEEFWEEMDRHRLAYLNKNNGKIGASKIAGLQDVKILQRFGDNNVPKPQEKPQQKQQSREKQKKPEEIQKDNLAHCGCSKGCDTLRCSCHKAGKSCSALCHGPDNACHNLHDASGNDILAISKPVGQGTKRELPEKTQNNKLADSSSKAPKKRRTSAKAPATTATTKREAKAKLRKSAS